MSEAQEATQNTTPAEPTDATPLEGQATEATPKAGLSQDDMQSLIADLRKENAKHRTANKAAEKAAAQAEEQRLLDNGKIQEAYDKVRGEYDTLQADLKASEHERRKMQVAQEFNLPPALLARLQGETLEDMQADAAILAEFVTVTETPPPPASTDSSSGVNAVQPTTQSTDREIKEQAVRLGVHPEHLKVALGIN